MPAAPVRHASLPPPSLPPLPPAGKSKEVDESGFFTYTRPQGKSGGHGVGWSEIPQYSFKVRYARTHAQA